MSVSMTPELYTQLRAFVRNIANMCAGCMRRNLGYCVDCPASLADVLGKRMDAGMPISANQLDTSLTSRMDVILTQLRKAKCPLRAVDIDTRDYCSKELKHWTLNKLIALGKIRCEKDGYFHKYSIVETKKTRKQK